VQDAEMNTLKKTDPKLSNAGRMRRRTHRRRNKRENV
jgi:hypothetical protein